MKKLCILALAGVMIMAILAAGCGGDKKEAPAAQQEQKYTIKVANYYGIDHPQNVALREKFKPVVEQKSNGSLKVEIFENNKLGAEQQFYTGVRNGTIEMAIPGMIMQADVPRMGVVEWPFLLKDFKHAKKVLESPIGKEMTDEMEKLHGVKALAWSVNGFRQISSNRQIASMQDFKGFKLRMPNSAVFPKIGAALGAIVSPMPLSEVFTALEQKVVDGQDNPIGLLRANGFFEVQTHVLESYHVFTPNVLIINKKFWDKLSPNQQKALEEAAKAYADYQWELSEKSYDEDKKFLISKGLKFITPDAAFKKQMEDAMKPIYDEYYAKYPWSKEMVDKIKAMEK